MADLPPGVTEVLGILGACLGAYIGVRLAIARIEVKHDALRERVDDHDRDIDRIGGQVHGQSRKLAGVEAEIRMIRDWKN